MRVSHAGSTDCHVEEEVRSVKPAGPTNFMRCNKQVESLCPQVCGQETWLCFV
jgi:hypothetical protein